MTQYYRLMTTVRNPGSPRDQLITTDASSDHIVVAHRDQVGGLADLLLCPLSCAVTL